MVDFQALKKAVGIGEVVLDFLDLDVTLEDDKLRGTCPVCESSNPRSLLITPNKGLFYCFAKKTGGDQIALTAHIKGCSNRQAAEMLAEKYMAKKPATKQDTPPDAQNAPLLPLDYLEPAHELVDQIGFSEVVAELIGIGYAPKGMMRGHIAVPIRLPDGTLVAYIGLGEESVGFVKVPNSAKWRIPQGCLEAFLAGEKP